MAARQCPQCKTVAEPDARFCGVCGAPVPLLSENFERALDRALDSALAQPSGARVMSPAGGVPISKASAGRSGPIPMRPLTPPPVVAAARPASLDSLLGRTLKNRYRVERKIGEGGFGAVFEGKQLTTGRPVALKILHPHSVADATVVARFRREAEACSQLRNPHTVTIYDFDQSEDGTLYLAMELVRGESLQEIQHRDGVIEPTRALCILDQVAEALAEAHDRGIVHRDMKPENIMVERRGEADFVKVLDFGIAKILSGEGNKAIPALTAIGQTVGNPGIHVARTTARQGARWALGHLRPRHGRLRNVDRAASLQGRQEHHGSHPVPSAGGGPCPIQLATRPGAPGRSR